MEFGQRLNAVDSLRADTPTIMTLSTYDPVKGCFVLKPMTQPIINAFHPDYVKTYMPDILTAIKVDEKRTAAGETLSKHVTEKRKKNPLHGFVHGVSKAAKVNLAPREFHVFNKAGTANLKVKGKKK
jgi:hypothetical protein